MEISWQDVSSRSLIVQGVLSSVIKVNEEYELLLTDVDYIKGCRLGDSIEISKVTPNELEGIVSYEGGKVIAFLNISRSNKIIYFLGGQEKTIVSHEKNVVDKIERLVDIEGKILAGLLEIDYPKSSVQVGRIYHEIHRLRKADSFDEAFYYLYNLVEEDLIHLVKYMDSLEPTGKSRVSKDFSDQNFYRQVNKCHLVYVSDVLDCILFYRFRNPTYSAEGGDLESRFLAYQGWSIWAWYQSKKINAEYEKGTD